MYINKKKMTTTHDVHVSLVEILSLFLVRSRVNSIEKEIQISKDHVVLLEVRHLNKFVKSFRLIL